jgi:hypothetical protein
VAHASTALGSFRCLSAFERRLSARLRRCWLITSLTYIEAKFRENLTRKIENFGASSLPQQSVLGRSDTPCSFWYGDDSRKARRSDGMQSTRGRYTDISELSLIFILYRLSFILTLRLTLDDAVSNPPFQTARHVFYRNQPRALEPASLTGASPVPKLCQNAVDFEKIGHLFSIGTLSKLLRTCSGNKTMEYLQRYPLLEKQARSFLYGFHWT